MRAYRAGTSRLLAALTLLVLLGWPNLAAAADAPLAPSTAVAAQQLVDELKAACPPADPGDQAAFDSCRVKLYNSAGLQRLFAPRLTWGAFNPEKPVWKHQLTTFDAKLFIGLYLPLFTYDGTFEVKASPGRTDWKDVHVHVGFRNRLQPGQYPYPFWHTAEKWDAYGRTTTIVFHVDPATATVWTALRFADPAAVSLTSGAVAAPAFDGKWMWQDANGQLQPAVTLYDGLMAADNPFKGAMQIAFEDFANAMRAQSCSSCHSPSNTSAMSPLVLLQTPAHAAGEIDRVIHAIEIGKMPLDETGLRKVLSADEKAAFLDKARGFKQAVDRARAWEAQQKAKSAGG